MKRRGFTKNAPLLAASLLFLKCKTDKQVKEVEALTNRKLGDFGLQLWSIREAMAKDPISTLKIVADIGFTDIECAGYNAGSFYGMDAKEFKSILDGLGLKMQSGHTMTGAHDPKQKGTMTNDWESFLADHKKMGAKSVVCAYFIDDERKSLDDYKRHAELFNKCAEKAKEYGMMFLHHNHDFEFFPIDDQVPYDILLNETDPRLVQFELDHYWIKKANRSPFEYFDRYPGRFPVWHVKDMDDTEEKFFTEVGTGIIDYTEIFKKEKESGMQYFYVEQDDFKSLDPISSVKQSHDYLRKMTY